MKSPDRFYFKSSINIWTEILIWGLVFFMAATIIFTYDTEEPYLFWVCIFHGAVIAFLLWIRYDTYYILTSTYLYYRSGPIRGKITIKNITKIKSHHGLIVQSFLKPALGYDGLYIFYNKFDDIYLSPLDKEGFKKKLMEFNTTITNLD